MSAVGVTTRVSWRIVITADGLLLSSKGGKEGFESKQDEEVEGGGRNNPWKEDDSSGMIAAQEYNL